MTEIRLATGTMVPAVSQLRAPLALRLFKRAFDLLLLAALLPVLLGVGLALLLLNPFLNRGPLFFVQDRMGRDCRPFHVWKFRTMTPSITKGVGVSEGRGAFDKLDCHRITPLGRALRRTRLDELPQLWNVLRGEMSLIGPRPDYLPHALVYVDLVPGYRERHAVRPGISGLAQTEVGYVEGLAGLCAKVEADLRYVEARSLRLEMWITWRTLCVVMGRKGS